MQGPSHNSQSYRTLAHPAMAELVEKKSRFLCVVLPVTREDEAHDHIAKRKKEHWSGNHHCSAFRLNDGTERASDDGEPSGTAGKPMLHVLSQQDLTGVLAIVTRYFGGTLLGAGGLVRAYSGAVAAALKEADITEYALHEVYSYTLSYSEYEHARDLYQEASWRVEAEFAEAVHMTLTVPAVQALQARVRITALTRNAECAVPIDTCLLPVKGSIR